MSTNMSDHVPEDELDPSLVKLACQNRIKNRSKRSPEWIFFADAGMWQTVNGDESKFRIANCRYCLKADIQTKIRGKIETMKNHIMECDKIPASQKAVYERHPARYRKRVSNGAAAVDAAKRQKFDGLLKAGTFATVDGYENRAVVLHGTGDLRVDRVPIPSIPAGHVLIAMRSVGICGSVSFVHLSEHRFFFTWLSVSRHSCQSNFYTLFLFHSSRMYIIGHMDELAILSFKNPWSWVTKVLGLFVWLEKMLKVWRKVIESLLNLAFHAPAARAVRMDDITCAPV